MIMGGLNGWFNPAFIVLKIQISESVTGHLSVAVTLHFMNGKPLIPGMYQTELMCFQGWCHVLRGVMMGTVHVSGHQGPYSNQLYKWAEVRRAGEMLSITVRLRGAAGVCVESPAHTDTYKRLCDVLEQMSRDWVWHMTDSSFDSPRKVCREVSI